VQRGAPFRSGRYLLSLDLVEAEGGRLRVTSLDSLRRVEASPRQVTAVFEDGHTVAFPVARHEDPAALAAEAQATVTSACALNYPADEGKLSRLDPFFELRVTEDWASAKDTGSAGRSRLPWLAAAALVAAVPVGIGLRTGRNALSDELMFLEAKTPRPGEDVPAKLTAYMERGRGHRVDASRILVDEAGEDRALLRKYARAEWPLGELADDALFELAKGDPDELVRIVRRGGPRAAAADEALFAIARRIDTPAAYTSYLEHGSSHAAEVRQELRPDAEFRQAVRSGLVGSLFSFARRNPGSKHEDEAWNISRAHYAQALPAFRAANRPPPDGRRFAEALLAALQDRADPRVTVEVKMGDATAIAKVEAGLAQRHGDRFLSVVDELSADHLEGVAREVRIAVAEWFGRAFPHGVAEVTSATDDENRPRFTIRCYPAAFGVLQRRLPGGSPDDPLYATPQVGFDVEVQGAVPAIDGKEATVAWKLRVEDTSGFSTPVFGGVYMFFYGVPTQIAASFDEKL
jgi:hypothetical protein